MLGAPAKRKCGKIGGKQNVEVCLTEPKAPTEPINDPDAACRLLSELRTRDRESFVTVSINARNQVLGVEETARGTVTGVDVHPREVFKSPILLGASAIIVAHNHPSGDVTPSPEDLHLTRRLKEIGDIMGIPVLDSLIVGGKTGCKAIIGDGLAGYPSLAKKRRR